MKESRTRDSMRARVRFIFLPPMERIPSAEKGIVDEHA